MFVLHAVFPQLPFSRITFLVQSVQIERGILLCLYALMTNLVVTKNET